MDDPLIQSQCARIIAFAMGRRLPVMAGSAIYTTLGGLMSYGPNQVDMWRRAAAYVDKILEGRSLADLPVEQRQSSS